MNEEKNGCLRNREHMMVEYPVRRRYFIPPPLRLEGHHLRGDKNNVAIVGQGEGCEVLDSRYDAVHIVLASQQL